MKFIEIGIGNKWFIRTEIELSDGKEFEVKGVVRPISFQSAYIRIWILKTVFILDMKQGFKKVKKNRTTFKLIFGIVSI